MSTLITVGIAAGVILMLLLVMRIFTSPIKIIFKLLLNTILGFFALIAINYFGAFIGLTIGVNFINALVIGCLGVPGVGLLLLLRWLMIT
ncbi:MAG: Pro-sigmaK processing inhibitor BofA [Clostridiales bacterium]|jgi:inhibitor of the pro-sigma K processing machinery|nr:Pro-sigmaK processing inhibitor BofA [Clostridiales bacterium]